MDSPMICLRRAERAAKYPCAGFEVPDLSAAAISGTRRLKGLPGTANSISPGTANEQAQSRTPLAGGDA